VSPGGVLEFAVRRIKLNLEGFASRPSRSKPVVIPTVLSPLACSLIQMLGGKVKYLDSAICKTLSVP
jgi:hypothetical protein